MRKFLFAALWLAVGNVVAAQQIQITGHLTTRFDETQPDISHLA